MLTNSKPRLQKKLKDLAMFCLVLTSGISACVTTGPPQRVSQVNADVYYGGIYMIAGTQEGLKQRFPELYSALTESPGKEKYQREILDRFMDRKEKFSKINLTGFSGELAPNDAVVMACGFTGEKYFSEAVVLGEKEVRNVTAYLGGALLLQNFQRRANGTYDIKLLACYPFSMTCIGLVKDGESPEAAGGRLIKGDQIGLGSEAFNKIMEGLAGQIAPVTGLGATMQVRNIRVDEKAEQFVGVKFGGSKKEFEQWLAGELGSQLARHIGLSIIPFAEDTSSRKLAVMMENQSAQQIAIPEPDFFLDIEIQGFSRKMAKRTVSESLWVYGAYANVSISEAGTGMVMWQKDVKAGVPKKIATTQTVIDHSGAEFSALMALLGRTAREILSDPQARPVLNACLK